MRSRRPRSAPPVTGAIVLGGSERELRLQEAEEAAALAAAEGKVESRRRATTRGAGVDHSRHQCNNDPADPWSECTTDRPW